MAEVQIKATHIVRPSGKTWTGTMKMSEFDMALGKGFVPSLYLYRPHKDWDAAAITQTLKDSLGKALVHFYPFAGRLRPTDGGRMELVLDEEVWGVPVLEAETAVEVAELGDLAEAEEKRRFQHLAPMADYRKPLHELPLLTVQITHFRCGGVGVGILMSHAVVDGLGAGHFYSEWARLARGEALELVPINDRSLLRAGEAPRSPPAFSLQPEAALPPPPMPPMMPPPPPSDSGMDGPPPPMMMPPFLQTITLKLPVSKSQINKLKQIAGDVTNGRPYSRFEVLTAHAWRCASKARGHEGKKLNALGIAVDIRRRINPPLPRAFVGNAVVMLTATSESEDLVSNPVGYACSRIRQTIDKVTDEFVWKYVDYQKSLEDLGAWRGMMTLEGQFVNPDVMMISWMNLSINGLDFGWGNEAHMASSPQALEGVASLLPGKEEGSVLVVMCLQVAHVDKFKDYFFTELN
ncbi:hypothetical protein V2J09_013167 [Rumex salicifolius]